MYLCFSPDLEVSECGSKVQWHPTPAMDSTDDKLPYDLTTDAEVQVPPSLSLPADMLES